ncbi:MAG: hypothetical protein CMM10_13300 [Rhodospirillaceae bacterium]|jgi:hypothetical protein|nr:hypothetical protein [Rhodospirillaceae bacterium]MDP6644346.1 MMPL family transporter [Rhodospirillales bacterium]
MQLKKSEAALKWWIQFITENAKTAVAAISILTIAIGYFAATSIGINTDTEDMLSPDLAFRQNAKELDRAFPQFDDNIVIVLDGGNADLLADAADVLAGELAKFPGLYGRVFAPEGLPFFTKNGFLYLSTDELESLVARLNDAQPFIGKLWNDPTLPGLFGTLRLILKESAEKKDKTDIPALGEMLKATVQVIRAQIAGERKYLSWRELIAGKDVPESRKYRTIVLQPRLNYRALQPGGDVINRLRKTFSDLALEDKFGVRARLTGSVALEHEELASVVDGLGLAGVLSFSLVVLLLIWGLKSLKLSAAVLLTLIVGLIWTAGFAAWAVGTLNLISIAFAVLFIGLSVDFGIHYTLRFREAMIAGSRARGALVEAGGDVGGALILSALAAAIGFLAFVPTDYIGLAELGIIAGGGMFIALAANVTLLPALLMLTSSRIGQTRSAQNSYEPGIGNKYRWNRPLGFIVGAAGIIGLILLPEVRFDFDPLNLKDRNSESVATLFALAEANDEGPYRIEFLARDIEKAREFAQSLENMETVKSAFSINDLIPSMQEAKLEIAETLGFTLAPSLSIQPERRSSNHADRLSAFQDLRGFVNRANNSDYDKKLLTEIDNLLAALDDFATKFNLSKTGLEELETRLTSTLVKRLLELRHALEVSKIDLNSLPEELISRQIAEDGRAKVTVTPKADMTDRKALTRFVSEVRTVAPNAAGSPVTILEAGRVVVEAFVQAALWAFLLIAALVIVITKNTKEVLLIFAPLLVAASLTMAVSVLADLPFNFANVIVLPLLFGLGIASAIHLVMREKSTGGKLSAMNTSTPRAVVFSALTTIGSFASIALSSHPGTASMGVLLTIAIILTLICTLTVLPALLSVLPLGNSR